ncbi:hypothetical protein [Salinispora tropica]|uniref:hypothetical protein n=1 Tax=Salinispora tropica TaxID=168695 RepID=UPI000368497F|nr:hypothetical protein [Salinispora tropica]
MSTKLPRLLAGLVDDAAVFPPGSASLPDAVTAHRQHRSSWYAELVGPLLVPASTVLNRELHALVEPVEELVVGLIGDTGLGGLSATLAAVPPGVTIQQVEVAVAARGADPQPGLTTLFPLVERLGGRTVYAEIPLTFGLMGALDRLVEARAAGLPVAAKFRTGGLAAELFPTPTELATVIHGCQQRELPFKLTAGLHQAMRHLDSETGFTHHGFANVLAAALVASGGAGVEQITELLTATDPRPLLAPIEQRLEAARPLWVGYGSCSILEPLTDLIQLGLVNGGIDA